MYKIGLGIIWSIGILSLFLIFPLENNNSIPAADNVVESKQGTQLNTLLPPHYAHNTPVSAVIKSGREDDLESQTKSQTLPGFDNTSCSINCLQCLNTLRLPDTLSDVQFESILGHADELTKYLRKNTEVRAELIGLISTVDGNRRKLIIAAFTQLELNDQLALGQALIESPDWHHRLEGVSFLTRPENLNDTEVRKFADMLLVEQNQYIRTALLNTLKQPEKFYANQDVLLTLEQLTYSEPNDELRGQALLARIELEQNPENVFYDALTAIRSNAPDYQRYGLQALEKIISGREAKGLDINRTNDEEARRLFDELINSKYDDMPADLRKEADNLYDSFFRTSNG